jgi:hypothetical protein
MPETSLISPAVVRLGGGLVLDKDTFSIPPGAALQLQNFEPDINGGYRRINGFAKYDTNQVGGSAGTILGVHVYQNQVIAAKGTEVYKGTGSGWTTIDTGRTSAGRYDFQNYNFDNTEKVVWCDGTNSASIYNNSSVTDINTPNAPVDPQFVAVFKNHLFFGGMSTNPQEMVFTAPYTDTDFSVANGSGSIKVDSAIRKLKVFRDRLYIFCEDAIFLLAGSSLADFQLQPVTRNIGCVDGFSVQEIAGDIVYLAPDGLRTIAGTDKIGDVELGTVSKQIQPRLDNISTDRISSLVKVLKQRVACLGLSAALKQSCMVVTMVTSTSKKQVMTSTEPTFKLFIVLLTLRWATQVSESSCSGLSGTTITKERLTQSFVFATTLIRRMFPSQTNTN